LRALAIVWTVLFLTIDIAVVADLPLSRLLGWGTFGYGLINSAFGAGALVGALLARKMTRRMEPWAVLVGAVGPAVGYAITGLAPFFLLVLPAQFLAAATDAGDDVAGTSIIQRLTPDEIRGRVFSAIFMAGLLANAVGFASAGFLIEAFGPRTVYLLAALGSAAAAPLLIPLFRGLRDENRSGKQ
jgi:MFS family permease